MHKLCNTLDRFLQSPEQQKVTKGFVISDFMLTWALRLQANKKTFYEKTKVGIKSEKS